MDLLRRPERRAPIVERLNKELRAILATADMKKLLVDAGSDPTPSTPEQYAANIQHEEGKWADSRQEARAETRIGGAI